MVRSFTFLLVVPLVAAAFGGCLLFDPTFDESLVDEHGEGELSEVADHCSGDVPLWESSTALRTISIHGLDDLVSDLSTCGLPDAEMGPDAFFQFDALAGQRWHIMARPTDPLNDVAIHVMSTCDERACVRAAQSCAHGHSEHMNFVPAVGGRYIVGVQSAMHDDISVLAISPPCGDGEVQHGEACDDGTQPRATAAHRAARSSCSTRTTRRRSPTTSSTRPRSFASPRDPPVSACRVSWAAHAILTSLRLRSQRARASEPNYSIHPVTRATRVFLRWK